MKKMVFALGLLAAVALAAPCRAHTDFSFAIGLPGFFGVFGGPPCPRPPALVYAPPVPYYAPPVPYYPPVAYRPYYGYGYRGWDRKHRKWHGHHYDHHDRHDRYDD
jgi:hypothetical protein